LAPLPRRVDRSGLLFPKYKISRSTDLPLELSFSMPTPACRAGSLPQQTATSHFDFAALPERASPDSRTGFTAKIQPNNRIRSNPDGVTVIPHSKNS
jgi:hypothetical protein